MRGEVGGARKGGWDAWNAVIAGLLYFPAALIEVVGWHKTCDRGLGPRFKNISLATKQRL